MDVLSEKIVILRKNRRCDGCRSMLFKGQNILRQAIANEGEVYSVYSCDCCTWVISKFYSYGDEIEQRGIEEYVYEFIVNPIVEFIEGLK